MGKLGDIVAGNNDNSGDWWDSTQAAADFGVPLPRGVYECHATKGEHTKSKLKGTECYNIEFTVLDSEYKGRKLWYSLWLTPAARQMSKRELMKLGFTSQAQLDEPLPRWWRCRVTAVVRKDDSGVERNEVKGFEVLGFDKPNADPFAPPDVSGATEADDVRENW